MAIVAARPGRSGLVSRTIDVSFFYPGRVEGFRGDKDYFDCQYILLHVYGSYMLEFRCVFFGLGVFVVWLRWSGRKALCNKGA